MRINFQQGIITYPSAGPTQSFLAKTGVYVSLQTTNGRTDVTFAHGQYNYLFTEASDVPNAWGPIPAGTDTWLFWDIDSQTAVRTFGFTLLQPLYGTTFPVTPAQGQHFFHTTEKKMYLYDAGNWRVVIRAFAAKVNNSTFTPLGSGSPLKPYAGTQVGLNNIPTVTGRILVDDTGAPIRRQDGTFFTTEDDIFINGSPANTIRLEANVLTATALENLAAYQVVYFSEFGKINIATYYDLQEEMLAMLMEGLNTNETGTVITQGTVTNPDWNFTTVGALLWVDMNGVLVEQDPHITDIINYPVGKPPIGRVITPTTIFFDQGLGGKGDKGEPGPVGEVDLATNVIFGISKLSVAALDPNNPIVVGDNDPRNYDARTPLPHNQAATTITFTPYGALTAPNVQLVLQQLEDTKVNRSGDVMTGFLTLNASPTLALHAATKSYVDAMTLANLNDVTLVAPAPGEFLYYNGGTWQNKTLDLTDLGDVDTTGVISGDYLSFNGTNWVPVGGLGDLYLNDLLDVNATDHSNPVAFNAGENSWLRWNTSTSLWESEVGMPYDLHFFMPGEASGIAGVIMGGIVTSREVYLPPDFSQSVAQCEIPSLSPVTFTLYVANNPWCDIVFPPVSNIGVFDPSPYAPLLSTVIPVGTRVVIKPQGNNNEIQDVMITIVGCTTKLLCPWTPITSPVCFSGPTAGPYTSGSPAVTTFTVANFISNWNSLTPTQQALLTISVSGLIPPDPSISFIQVDPQTIQVSYSGAVASGTWTVNPQVYYNAAPFCTPNLYVQVVIPT